MGFVSIGQNVTILIFLSSSFLAIAFVPYFFPFISFPPVRFNFLLSPLQLVPRTSLGRHLLAKGNHRARSCSFQNGSGRLVSGRLGCGSNPDRSSAATTGDWIDPDFVFILIAIAFPAPLRSRLGQWFCPFQDTLSSRVFSISTAFSLPSGYNCQDEETRAWRRGRRQDI